VKAVRITVGVLRVADRQGGGDPSVSSVSGQSSGGFS
jgi:hypothetical protein